MQQTADVDADAVTKDQMDADVDSETTLVSGLSYSSYSVAADAVLVEAAMDADATIAVSGSSSYSSSVADSVLAEAEMVADVAVAATICAANLR